jgi:sugar phosphate isomerase/epimerase
MTVTIDLALHSFSCRLRYLHDPGYDVFSFIDDAAARGFTGVNISLSGPDNDRLPPNRHLSGDSPEHLQHVAEHLQRRGLSVELDTDTVEFDRLPQAIDTAKRLHARVLRTFTHHPYGPRIVDATVRDLRAIAPAAEQADVIIAVENHEEFTSTELAHIAATTDHPWIRLLFDYGNSIPVLEPPEDALRLMRPWVVAAHMKDTVMIAADHTPDGVTATMGVPLGQGSIDVLGLTRTLVGAGLRRICLQNVWGYHVPLGKLRPVPSRHPLLGTGPFAFAPPPFAPSHIIFDPEADLEPTQVVAAEKAALDIATRAAQSIIYTATTGSPPS